MLPVLSLMLRRRKRPVGLSWRMDETYLVCSQSVLLACFLIA